MSRQLFVELLESRRMLASDWTNPVDRLDVNNDGFVAPVDVLVGINEINEPTTIQSDGRLPSRELHPSAPYWDVNGDSYLTPLDVLIVINALNDAIKSPVYRWMDDGQFGYEETGSGWTASTHAGAYQGDFRSHAPGVGLNVAAWQFDVSPGAYRVSVSWPGNVNHASNAPYTIYDDDQLLREMRVDQRQPANDFQDQGVFWEDLGVYHAVGRTLTVRLDDRADQMIAADGVRVERIADVLEWSRAVVPASTGGVLTLPSGSSVSLPPGALPADQAVTLLLMSDLPGQPPIGLVKGIGPSLALTFSTPESGLEMASPEPAEGEPTGSAVEFHVNYGSRPVAGLAGALPFVDLVNASGQNHVMGVPGTVDANQQTAHVDLPAEVIRGMIEQEFVRDLGHAIIRIGATNLAVEQLGKTALPRPEYWDKSSGQLRDFAAVPPGTLPADFTTDGRTLVLVHGILSNAEMAFGGCLEQIRQQGGYDQVVAFSYDSTRGIEHNGTALAYFLKDLEVRGIKAVDIEAHSYGTLVTSVAASKTDIAALPIHNLIFLGGPLTGTPMADTLVGIATILMILGKSQGGIPEDIGVVLENVLARGMADDIRAGVPQAVFDKINAERPNTTIYVQAGTDAFADDPALPDESKSGEQFGWFGKLFKVFSDKLIDGQLYPAGEHDSLVPRWSGELRERNVNRLVRLPPLPLSHSQLQCNVQARENVFSQVAGPTPEILVSTTLAPTTTEGGGSTTFTIELSRDPVAPVTINLYSSEPLEGIANPLSVVLTQGRDPVTITVSGQDDDILDGDQPYTIVIEPAISEDGRFHNIDPVDVTVVNLDNELPPAGITVEILDSITSEDGDQAQFQIRLDSPPTAEVSIWLSPTDNDRGEKEGLLDKINVRFTEDNWDEFQVVTVIGQDDQDDDGDYAYRVLGVALSDDPRYDVLHMPDVHLVNLDNDGGGSGTGNLLLQYSVSASGQTVNGTLTLNQLCGSAGNAPPGAYHLVADSGGLVTTFNTRIQTVSEDIPHTVIFTTQGALGTNGSGQFNFFVDDGQVSGAGGVGFIRATVSGVVYQGSIIGGSYTPMDDFVDCFSLRAETEGSSLAPDALPLAVEELVSLEAAAVNAWFGGDPLGTLSDAVHPLPAQIVELPGSLWGMATPSRILNDRDDAGYGGYVETTPLEGDAFDFQHGLLIARHGTASDRIDLLTALVDDTGDLAGFDHVFAHDDELDEVLASPSRLR